MTKRIFKAGIITAAIITVGLFAYPDYTQDMLYVSQQTIGALFLAIMANFMIAVGAGIFAKGKRTVIFLQVFFVSFAFTVVVFLAVGYFASLDSWPDN